MLESLFQYPTVFARRCEGPAADERSTVFTAGGAARRASKCREQRQAAVLTVGQTYVASGWFPSQPFQGLTSPRPHK